MTLWPRRSWRLMPAPLALATLACADLLIEAGLPDGVVNVISGTDYAVTQPLLESPIPAMFTMIGSTSAGVSCMKSACTNVKHL